MHKEQFWKKSLHSADMLRCFRKVGKLFKSCRTSQVIPKEVVVSLRKAIQECKACRETLRKSWGASVLPVNDRWDPWSLANEIRYAGQHICRVLTSKTKSERLTEIGRAKDHCENAVHDACDYLVLWFSRHILKAFDDIARAAPFNRAFNYDDPTFIGLVNSAKRDYLDICNILAANDRKNPDFEKRRRESIVRLEELHHTLVQQRVVCVQTGTVPVLTVTIDSLPTPQEMRDAFTKAEAYLKKYELVSGEVCVSGIYDLFEASCFLVDSDFRLFMGACFFAQIRILEEIVLCFREKLSKQYLSQLPISEDDIKKCCISGISIPINQGYSGSTASGGTKTVITTLRGKEVINQRIVLLEEMVKKLEAQWCGN